MSIKACPQTPEFVREINPGERDHIYWKVLGDCFMDMGGFPKVSHNGKVLQSLSALNTYDGLVIVPINVLVDRYQPTTSAQYIAEKLEPYIFMKKAKILEHAGNTLNLCYDTESQKTNLTCLTQWVNKLEDAVKDLPHLMHFLPVTIQCFTTNQTEEPFMTLNFIMGSEKANKVRTINIA